MATDQEMLRGSSVSKFVPLIKSIKNEFTQLKKQYTGFEPVVAVIEIEQVEVPIKSYTAIPSPYFKDVALQCGIKANSISLPRNSKDSVVLEVIKKLNTDPNTHGIIVELNDSAVDSEAVLNAILPSKDVTGVSKASIENINATNEELLPSSTAAIKKIIEIQGTLLENSKAFVLGNKSITFPISLMLLKKNVAVTMCHSVTENIAHGINEADIIINATRQLSAVKNQLKPGALLIECFSSEGQEETCDSDMPEGKQSHIDSKNFQYAMSVMTAQNILQLTKHLFEAKWNLSYIPLKFGAPGLSDIEIARAQSLKDIRLLAKEIGLYPHEVELYGDTKAKISLSVLERCKFRSPGKYVVVAGITPTPLGEGKSTTTIGLCQALAVHLQKNVIACLRQPSQGPTFGIKGGAAGGGYAQVVPMEEFNLHLTGDIHAVTAANNLLAAQIDARMFHEATQKDDDLFRRLLKVVNGKQQFSKIQISRLQRLGIQKTDPCELSKEEISRFARLDIDPSTITWHRVLDTNDRFLRKIAVGLAATEKNMSRDTQFDIAVASEIMAILALTTDMADMKKRLSKIVVANDKKGNPVTADDLGVTGALAVLLKDTIRPNLMQGLEGIPVFVHAGPFANIAHGNSSIIADKLALKIVGKHGFVVTEAGFGSDIGLEKFCDIKCRNSGLVPNVAVIVATVRALKLHGGGPNIGAGSLPKEYKEENIDLVQKGYCNLAKHIQIGSKFGLPVVIALNRFNSDTDAELNLIKELAEKDGAFRCVICSHFSEGGKGAEELAKAVAAASELPSKFTFLYDLKSSLEDKISVIAKGLYGADSVEYKERAREMIKLFEQQGFGGLPICMAKTPLSLSDNPAKKGVPVNFSITIQDVKLSAGAGFVYPLAGSVTTMPGLPTRPCFYDIDIDAATGDIEGLF